MHFQLRTDNHIINNERLADWVHAEVDGTLGPRFGERLRRVEVYLEDRNAHKRGTDTRCTVEVHLAGMSAVAAEGRAAGVAEALDSAIERVLRAIEHRLGRLEDRAGQTPASGQEFAG